MMPITRQQVEILLDTPDQRDYVVSAYADLTVRDGFKRYLEQSLNHQAKSADAALARAPARKDLDANINVIREAVQVELNSEARGLAVFSSVARGLREVIPLEFPVENHLVIDEEPFLLPLLERWYCEPAFLIALFNDNEAHLYERHHGRPEPVRDLEREDATQDIQRDKPRFTYKKRFTATRHERLHGTEDSPFLRELSDAIAERWKEGDFAGLVLLGKPQDTAALRKVLPKTLDAVVVGEATHAMTGNTDDLNDAVSRLVDDWQSERQRQVLAEFHERLKEKHLVANGATEVLDALQQGRATQILFGTRRDIPGAVPGLRLSLRRADRSVRLLWRLVARASMPPRTSSGWPCGIEFQSCCSACRPVTILWSRPAASRRYSVPGTTGLRARWSPRRAKSTLKLFETHGLQNCAKQPASPRSRTVGNSRRTNRKRGNGGLPHRPFGGPSDGDRRHHPERGDRAGDRRGAAALAR